VGGSADSWQNQLTFFSALGYEVVAPDLLGHGFSSTPDRPKAYTFTKLFRDTLTIFDHFCVSGGRQNPCIVIGHSYGGSIATALARSRPEQIKVLVRKSKSKFVFFCLFFPLMFKNNLVHSKVSN
jgi:abhydrolase domain-containing protein 8